MLKDEGYLITGVSSEMLNGNENTVYEPPFFFLDDGKHYWVQNRRNHVGRWEEDSVKLLKKDEYDYVQWLDEEDYVRITPNDRFYLAGTTLIQSIERLEALDMVENPFKDWKRLRNGYSAGVVNTLQAPTLFHSIVSELWDIVEDFLASGELEPSEVEQEAFHAYDHLSYYAVKPEEDLLRIGSYYMATDNEEILRYMALTAHFDLPEIYETENPLKYMEDVSNRLASYR